MTGHQEEKIRDLLDGKTVKFIHNPHFSSGMASSLRHGASSIAHLTDGVLVCLGDMPDLEQLDYEMIIRAFHDHLVDAVVPTWSGRQGHPVLFGKALFSSLREIVDKDQGAKGILAKLPPSRMKHVLMNSGACLRDYDDPDDFASLSLTKPPT